MGGSTRENSEVNEPTITEKRELTGRAEFRTPLKFLDASEGPDTNIVGLKSATSV